MSYKHSFAKVWLDSLGNKIYINNKNFFSKNIENLRNVFKIKPLETYIRIGENIIDDDELKEITTISYPKMKRLFGLTIYRTKVGNKRWKDKQRRLLYIGRIKHGSVDLPENSIKDLKIEWDMANQRVRGVGDDFGTKDGQYGIGDVTPWISVKKDSEKSKNINPLSKYNSYSEITKEWFELSRYGRIVSDKSKLMIKELPIMITIDGKLLCMPYDRNYVPKIVMVGETGCQPKDSKVIMADGNWKNIEDIKVGDRVASPVFSKGKWKMTKSKVSSKIIYKNEKIYDVLDSKNKKLYSCTGYHNIPLFNYSNNNIFNNRADQINGKAVSFCVSFSQIHPIKIKIKNTNKKQDVYGISINSVSEYYITDNWMVTHNSGKSWCLSSILGRVPFIFGDKAGLINDSSDQFYDLMLPMKQEGAMNDLNRIGNEPMPLPAITLYMSCPNLDIRYKNENVGYRLVISFKLFLRRWKEWTTTIPSWDLGKAGSYMTKNVIEHIKNCKSLEEIRTKLFQTIEVIDETGKKKKSMEDMIKKWCSKFENILRDEFTSNLFKNEKTTAPYWKLKKKNGLVYIGHPFIISAYAGLFPVINNTYAKDYPIAQRHLAYIIREIVKWQVKMKSKGLIERLWIGVDELKDLLGEKGSDVYKAIDYLFTQGRFPMVGFIGNLQEYTKMSDSMQNNTSHLVVFDLRKDAERKEIAKDYRLEKKELDEIAELRKNECLFITKKKMVIYDSDGTKEIKDEGIGGIWKGRIVPPITVHKRPSD